jgi:hypothetical protein
MSVKLLRAAFALLIALCASSPVVAENTLSYVRQPSGYATSVSGLSAHVDEYGVLWVWKTGPDHYVTLNLMAPTGGALLPGTYYGTTFPSDTAHAGLYFSGYENGCQDAPGTLTITDIVLGPRGYVQKLEAHWEQHCVYGSTSAQFGQVSIDNPPPPPPMTFELVPDSAAALDKTTNVATVAGSVRCSAPSTANISGELFQEPGSSKNKAYASFYIHVPCGPVASRWSAQVESRTATPLAQGLAKFELVADAPDLAYFESRTQTVSTQLPLDNSKHYTAPAAQ